MGKDNKTKWEIEHSTEDAVKAISSAASEAVKAIASAAGEARSVLANNAAEAAKVLAVKNLDGNSDHDLLVELKTKMDDLKEDIRDLKDNTSIRIKTLEDSKLDICNSYPALYKKSNDDTHDDFEKRLRANETKLEDYSTIKKIVYGSCGIILATVLTAVIYLVINK
jgi:hypothetical protein